MTSPATAREALIVEAIGDVAKLMRDVEVLATILNETCRTLQEASTGLHDELAGFERRMAAITEHAKTQTVRHMAARTDEATRQAIGLQSRTMADAARVAFGAELGATMQWLQTTLRPLLEERQRRWECWLTHAAAAVVSSAATWSLTVYFWPR